MGKNDGLVETCSRHEANRHELFLPMPSSGLR